MKFSIQERKKQVIILHKRGYTVRQIAKELRMSSRDVTKILKENEREEKEAREREVMEKEEKEKKRLFSSKRSEALKLYKKGITPLDVAIQLNIHPEEAKTIFLQYLSLQDLEDLIKIYQKLNNRHAFKSLIDLYFRIEENNISEDKIVELNTMIDSFPSIKKEYDITSNALTSLRSQTDELVSKNELFRNKIYESKIELNSLLNAIDFKKDELRSINSEIYYKKQLLEDIKNSEEYNNLKSKIEKDIDKCLSQKKDFIKIAFETILKFMKKDKNTKFFIKNIFYSPEIFVDHYISNYENQIIEMAESLYDDTVKNITNKMVNS